MPVAAEDRQFSGQIFMYLCSVLLISFDIDFLQSEHEYMYRLSCEVKVTSVLSLKGRYHILIQEQ